MIYPSMNHVEVFIRIRQVPLVQVAQFETVGYQFEDDYMSIIRISNNLRAVQRHFPEGRITTR